MSKSIAWEILKNLIYNQASVIAKKNESELSIDFINGSKIELKGADNEDSLRGIGLDHVVLDEYAYMKKEAWTEVIRPALSDKKGGAMFIGTPDSFNYFYELYQKGVSEEDGFKSWHFNTVDSPFIDPLEVESARKELDEKTFRQEYEASFEAASGRVYYAFDRIKNNTDLEYNPEFQAILCLDFNVSPMCWTVLQSIKGQDYCVDEIVRHNTNTEEMAKAVGDIYGYNRPYLIHGDYSGTFRSTNSRSTDYNIIQQILPYAEIRVKPNPIVVDRVNAVNSRLCSAAGIRNLFINVKRCPTLIRDFEQVVWKEGKREIDKDNIERTHSSDGVGYYIEYNYGLKGKVTSTIRKMF
jgi:hypothetical protein